MVNSTTSAGRYRPAKDRFALAVYSAVGLLAVAELFAVFWLDLI